MKRSFTDYISNIVTNAQRANTRRDISNEVGVDTRIRKGVHYKPAASQRNSEHKAPNHHYVFCTHEVPYWRTCSKCGRDNFLAKQNAEMVLKHLKGIPLVVAELTK